MNKNKQTKSLKRLLTVAGLVFITAASSQVHAQNGVGINPTGAAADPSAALDVASTNKGVLVPRMTAAEKVAIASPANGLLIFQTDDISGFWYYNATTSSWVQAVGPQGATGTFASGTNNGDMQYWNGSTWTMIPVGASGQVLQLNSSHVPVWSNGVGVSAVGIGLYYQGGIIVYILKPGDVGYDPNVFHGLIAAPSDQSISWHATNSGVTNATGTAIGTGNANTNAIIALYGGESNAASLCANLVLGGFSDWYLPSKDELYQLYINRSLIGVFDSNPYWSSTEYSNNAAWIVDFYNGNQFNYPKSLGANVRPVRSF